MAKLEAMLELRGIATPREMSEAIARCQLHGGDLTTSLLQFMSYEKVSKTLGLSETTLRRSLELLELPQNIQQELIQRPGFDLHEETITVGHAP